MSDHAAKYAADVTSLRAAIAEKKRWATGLVRQFAGRSGVAKVHLFSLQSMASQLTDSVDALDMLFERAVEAEAQVLDLRARLQAAEHEADFLRDAAADEASGKTFRPIDPDEEVTF